MSRRAMVVSILVFAMVAAVAVGGCASAPQGNGSSGAGGTPPSGAAGGAAGGTRLAPGLYDMPDGTVQAVGTLEWRDLEGGFWAVIGGTEGTGDAGKVEAVLAGIAKTDAAYAKLEGQPVMVVGKRREGASVRMAGPEIDVISIEAFDDAGPAQ